MRKTPEILIVSLLFILAVFIYKDQPRITLNNGKGWDGEHYYSHAEQYKNGGLIIKGRMPYVMRPGFPLMTATYSRLSGLNLLDSALHLNLTGAFILLILLIFWLHKFIPEFWIRLILYLIFIFTWHAPLRFSFFYPMLTDVWSAVFFTAGLINLQWINSTINDHKKSLLSVFTFSLIVSIGSLFRETNCILALAILFLIKKEQGINRLKLFIPLICVCITTILLSFVFDTTDHQTSYYIRTILKTIFSKSILLFVLALCIAYGPLVLIIPFSQGNIRSLFKNHKYLFFLFAVILLMAHLGGSDCERILFTTGFPVFFIFIGFAIKKIYNSKKWLLLIILCIQVISMRVFWHVSDILFEAEPRAIPLFTLLGNNFHFNYLYSAYGSLHLNRILLAEYFILFLFIAIVFSLGKRQEKISLAKEN